jgi:sugar phosphate isomerase/epimerase
MISRNEFLKTSALGLVSMGVPFNKESYLGRSAVSKDKLPPLGIAGWTFRYIDNHEAVKMMQRLNVKMTTLKSFQLPYDSSQETIKNVINMFNDAGITVYGVGVIYMKLKAEVDQAFEYAKKAGVSIIDAGPADNMLPYIEKKVKKYNIKLAIHNHGPGDRNPGPGDAYEKIKDLDSRMGLCYDIGHGMRAGVDPAEAFPKYQDRIFDMHIKDATKAKKSGKSAIVGRGIINFPKFVKTLIDNNYSGHYSIEHEVNMKDPLPGIAEDKGYFDGVSSAMLWRD